MLHVRVPGGADLALEHLVLDVNGTLTNRGELIDGVAQALAPLHNDLRLHILSADSFGTAEHVAQDLRATFWRIETGEDKRAYVEALGAERCAALGNGRNDVPMLRAAALGIAVVGPEGASAAAPGAADVAARAIAEALALLAEPTALTATLRL
jgi:P-type E1-E2 ATPase